MDNPDGKMLVANVDDSDGAIDAWRGVHRFDLFLTNVGRRSRLGLRKGYGLTRDEHTERNQG
jgi:hypothetical protein